MIDSNYIPIWNPIVDISHSWNIMGRMLVVNGENVSGEWGYTKEYFHYNGDIPMVKFDYNYHLVI